jgi:hypothetical protein
MWNHAHYRNPRTAVGTSIFGVINQSSVASRLIQFALKYQFYDDVNMVWPIRLRSDWANRVLKRTSSGELCEDSVG